MSKLPDNVMSKYRFVMLAALRAEQLQAGALPRIDSDTRKATVLAQEEVAAGVVDAWDGSSPAASGTDASAEE
jgi:DNA-directed RNA polymerase omega subunit